MALSSTVEADYLLPTNIGPMAQPPASKTLILLLWALGNLVTHFSALVTMTPTFLSPSTALTALLIFVSVGLPS
ncbi:hypothetical protein A2U01_0084720, partial [Trifolium medium]|nr:hypothetical protein [Trifolium medium]